MHRLNGSVRTWRLTWTIAVAVWLLAASMAAGQTTGALRGTVRDKDDPAAPPIPGAEVKLLPSALRTTTNDQGNFVFNQVPPGTYTVSISKDGYLPQGRGDVVVEAGKMADVEVLLVGVVEEAPEVTVPAPPPEPGMGTLEIMKKDPGNISAVDAGLFKAAGLSDAAQILKMVSGATVQNDKYAVVRGLPDRYVSSKMNGVRLPTADPDKRAVQLDQFPAALIDMMQVSKVFTPDQQGDASGGAVDIILKGLPDKDMFRFDLGGSSYSNRAGKGEYVTHKGRQMNWLGWDRVGVGDFSDPTVGASFGDQPISYSWSMAGAKRKAFDTGWKFGALGSAYYKTKSTFTDDGINDYLWADKPGDRKLSPQYSQGTPTSEDFKTALWDVRQSKKEVQWGGLGSLGLENRDNSIRLLYMYTRTADDTVTVNENTRGKAYYFPGYDVNDPNDPGNAQRSASPYLRTETLAYTERTTGTLQLTGKHTLPIREWGWDRFWFLRPELDWTLARSFSRLYQPDKRQFGEQWWADMYSPGAPPWVPPFTAPAVHVPYKPAANFTIGNLQRVWKDIEEDSDQYFANIKFPFRQWSNEKGYFKFGVFQDVVDRTYAQESYSNFNDNASLYAGPWGDFWSRHFPGENHPITAADIDVDYTGSQRISASYGMFDLPLTRRIKIIAGARVERTELSIVNSPEKDVTWIPPGTGGPVTLRPGDADVSFEQVDLLPSLGLEVKPHKKVTVRLSYSETVARQTFKELTPIQQMEYLGGDVFIGNPSLQMSAVKNYDLRLDYTPFHGSLLSASAFYKEVTNPIEYVQRNAGYTYTTASNYPEGMLRGVEFEARQKMGSLTRRLEGLTLGGNATIIESEVTLPPDEAAELRASQTPMSTRHMTNAPSYLLNLFSTYDWDKKGAQFGLFYNVKGDTLIAGAGQSNSHFIPHIYELPYGTLNFTASKKLGKHWKLTFQAKNLLDPAIQTVYRSDFTDEAIKSSYNKGMEFFLGLGAEF